MKAMSKKKQDVMDKNRPLFISEGGSPGAQENSRAHLRVDGKLCQYGFKSHSAAYALLMYQTAYLKCNYPV